MARINRSDIIQKAINDLALSTTADAIPTETSDKVVLTYDLNKKFSNFIADSSKSTTGTLTVNLPTTDSKSDVYVTGFDVSIIKDSTCDLATGNQFFTLVPDAQGIAKTLVQIPGIALTAQDAHVHADLTYPIKVKANSSVTLTPGTFTVGVCVRGVTVIGFITSSN